MDSTPHAPLIEAPKKMLQIVLSNCSPAESHRLARRLVEEGLAACVNVIPGVRSFYRWKDELCEDEEHTLLIKCAPERFEALRARLVELHSYSVPEVLALDVAAGYEPYLRWARSEATLDQGEGS